MNYTFQQVDPSQLSAEIEKLIFPPFTINKDDICIAFAAFENSAAIGLIAAFVYPINKEGFIASFFVNPSHRGKGIGFELMQKILTHFKEMEIKLLQINYSDKYETKAFLEKILQKTGWVFPPKVLLRRYYLDQYSFHPDWYFSPFPTLPKDCNLFSWKDASKEDLEQAKAWEKANPLLSLYSPFNLKHPLSEINSLGIHWKGILAGWMIVQRPDPKHLLYSGLFVIPELRGLGPSICLLKEAIRRHLSKEIETVGIVEINTAISPAYWNRFIKKRLAPFAFQVESILSTYKKLDYKLLLS